MEADKKKPIPSKGRRGGKQGKTKRRQDEDCGGAGLILAASEITRDDVLFGRGCSQSPGNVAFRQLIAEKGDDYRSTKRDMKNAFAERLVDEIASRGGRFLVPVKEGELGTTLLSLKSGPPPPPPTTTTTTKGDGKGKEKAVGADFWMVAEHGVIAEKVKQGLRDFVAAEDKRQGGNFSSATTNSVGTKKRLRMSDCSKKTPVSSSSSSSASMQMNINTRATSLLQHQNSAESASRIPAFIVSSSSSSATSRTETGRTTITPMTSRDESTATRSDASLGITAAMLASQSFHDFLSTIALPKESGQQASTQGVALPPTSGSAIASAGTSTGAFPVADASCLNPGTGATQHPPFAHADLSAMRQQSIFSSALRGTGPVTTRNTTSVPTMPTQAQCPPPRPLEESEASAAGDDDFQRVLGWLQQQKE